MSGERNGGTRAELFNLAALYALDALSGDERSEFERELEGNPQLRAEVDSMREVAGLLGAAAGEIAPTPDLGDRLVAAATAPPPAKPGVLLDRDGLLILRPDDMSWRPHSIEGAAVRRLHFDRDTGILTSIVRFRAGTTYPGHRHAAAEDLYVLQGEVEVHGVHMGPGDYCRAQPGSVHQAALALTDAMILVRSSIHDEVT